MQKRFPKPQGLYDPANEHDNCGIGFMANIKGNKTNDIVKRGLEILVNMTHRGAESSDNKSGDGAGILIQLPHEFFKSVSVSI
jgi:glutamate synthase (NADPH/NADH) large chain